MKIASLGRVGDLDESMLSCRSYGHTWRPYTATRVPQRRQFIVTLVCSGCTTRRYRLLSENGEILANRYKYVEGYAIRGGALDHDERNLIRLRSLQALLETNQGES